MQNFSITPKAVLNDFWRYRQLILSMIRREVAGRYRGSVLGLLWSFFNPVFMLAVYTFVFSIIFKARWTVDSDSKAEFALVLFAGLLIFNLFAECITTAPTLIQANTNYVKKVVFPLEILPLVIFGAAFFHAIISFIVWLIFSFFVFGMPHATLFLFPIILVPLTLLILGLSWFLASLGVFLRDISQIVGIIVTTMMFLTPIFYPVSAIPDKYHPYIYSNPLTFIIEQARGLLIFGIYPDWINLGLLTVLTFLFSWFGFVWFQKTRKGFADVL